MTIEQLDAQVTEHKQLKRLAARLEQMQRNIEAKTGATLEVTIDSSTVPLPKETVLGAVAAQWDNCCERIMQIEESLNITQGE